MHVLVFGLQSDDWMRAFAPRAPVWRLLPQVARAQMLKPRQRLKKRIIRILWRDAVVIPLMEDDIRACPPGYRRLVPSRATVDIFADKKRFAVFAQQCGLEELTPKVFASADHARFPCIIKRTNLNHGEGTVVADCRAELDAALRSNTFADHDYIIQAFIEGPEFTTNLVCRQGEIMWHCSFAYTITNGHLINSRHAETRIQPYTPPQDVLDAFKRFLAPVRYDGPCNIDYKIDAAGRLYVMEINPRFGGSLMRPQHVQDLRAALSTVLELAA